MPQLQKRLLRVLVVALVGVAAVALAAPAQSAPHPRDPHRAQNQLDGKGRAAPNDVAGWWVDESTQQLVVNVVGPRTAASDQFTAGTDPASVRVEPFSAPVTPLLAAPLVGGQAIYTTAGARCSIGFSTRYGAYTFVLTAGHCTQLGGTWSGYNRTTIGPVAASNFPNDDFGFIYDSNTAQWAPSAQVQSGPKVKGSIEAPVNAQVCRSGSTTGYHCGVLQAKNQTVNYGNGNVVYGLTRTNVCAEPGDSGGSFITPAGQAQGITSGGSGNCTTGGTTFFQPVNEALQRYRLTLVTG